MVQGFERREGAQDPNANKPLEGSSVQMGMVMAPRNSSVSGVGNDLDALGDALGALKKPLGDFFEKKKDQALVEGEMMYAQGKAEEEVRSTGNEYTVTGFMNMKARTDSNMWYQNKQNEIAESGKQIDPDTYHKQLSVELKGLMDSVQGADDTTKRVLLNNASSNFASLVGTHTKAYALWKKDETKRSLFSMTVSETERPPDPNGKPEEADNNLIDLLTHSKELSGLPEEDRKQVIAQAMLVTSQSGNPRLINAYNKMNGGSSYLGLEEGKDLFPGLLSGVIAIESGGRRYGTDGKVLRNTKSGAVGEMQVLPSTLKDPGFGIQPAKDDSPEEAARVGKEYLTALSKKYDGNPILTAMAYHGGPGTVDKALAAGDPRTDEAVTWEKFVDGFVTPGDEPQATKQYLKKLNPYVGGGQSPKEVLATGSLLSNLAKDGFDAADITAIQNSVRQQQEKKAASFSETRIKLEQQLKETAETDGNFDAGLKQIRQIKETMGLSDSWAEQQAGQLSRSIEVYQKTQAQRSTVLYANQTSTLGTLTKKEQIMGLDLQRAQDLGELQAAVQQGKLPKEQLETELFKKNLQFAHKNGIVDDKLASSIQAGLAVPFYEKEGVVSKETQTAFKKYLSIRDLAGQEYADKYAGDSKDLLDLARDYTSGENFATALISAKTVLEKSAGNLPPTPTVNKSEMENSIGKIIDQFDSSYMLGRVFEKPNALGANQVFDWEVQAAKEDPRLLAFTKQMYVNERRKGFPEGTVERRVREAMDNQVEFVLGSPLISKPGTSVREVAGIKSTDKNAVNKALQMYLQVHGPEVPAWKKEWNSFQVLGSSNVDDSVLTKIGKGVTGIPRNIVESTKEKLRGVPMMHVQYDAQEEALILRPYVDNERTQIQDAPHVVPLKTLGKLYNAYESKLYPKETVGEWAEWLRDKSVATLGTIAGFE